MADEGTSGLSMEKRAELQRLLRDCKRGKIDRIIVKSVSRFARNTSELLTALRFLKEVGVSVFFEEQSIDSDKLNSEMILTFPGMAAQQESVAISGNMRWSYKKRMESGEFNCCAPAYGFALADGKLIVNEAEASVIRCIFDRFLRGLGKQTIANQLNAENVPRRESKKWYAFTIHYILNNERYMGDALLQKFYTTDTLPFRELKNKGQRQQYYVSDANPPIVSRETYQAAQELQAERQKKESTKNDVSVLRGSIAINKVDFGGEPLSGAIFLLEYSVDDGVTWQAVRPASADDSGIGTCASVDADGTITTGEKGKAVFSELIVYGVTYRLTETAAPNGYELLAEPVFTGSLSANAEQNYELTFDVVNAPLLQMPPTGGTGNLRMVVSLATTVLLFGLLGITVALRRRKTN